MQSWFIKATEINSLLYSQLLPLISSTKRCSTVSLKSLKLKMFDWAATLFVQTSVYYYSAWLFYIKFWFMSWSYSLVRNIIVKLLRKYADWMLSEEPTKKHQKGTKTQQQGDRSRDDLKCSVGSQQSKCKHTLLRTRTLSIIKEEFEGLDE